MKHLLNNLSEEEKNSIREQHTDKIKIDSSKFKSLGESKLGDVRPITEQSNKFVLGTKQRADIVRKEYIEMLKSAISQLGTNDAYELNDEVPIVLLTKIMNETNKLMSLYKQVDKESKM